MPAPKRKILTNNWNIAPSLNPENIETPPRIGENKKTTATNQQENTTIINAKIIQNIKRKLNERTPAT